jgi:N-acetylglucosaminyldiphosphoundecaprenol N-acetyl-beta-D-mannosaminyltransferase
MNTPDSTFDVRRAEQSFESLLVPCSSFHILGVRIDDVTNDETLDLVEQFIAKRIPHQICTVNVEFIMMAQHHPAFRETINNASLCPPDSMGVLWAARRQGHPLRERVGGADLSESLVARAAQRGWRLYLLGAAPGVADKAASVLHARYPDLNVVGAFSGSPSPDEEDAIVERIRAAQSDILLVAFGAPAQDLWIARNQPRLQVPVAIGVGGTLDYFAGVARRAPLWVQRFGLEWLYRLIREPWRWRRQLALPCFVWQVLRAKRA